MEIIVTHIRRPVPEGYTQIYVGRAMPGQPGSPLGNPLPVIGARWTDEATRWTAFLQQSWQPATRAAAEQAVRARGYVQGDAAALYREVLRHQCVTDTPQFREVMRLARRVAAGEALALACWCAPAKTCHAEVIREAVLGFARRFSERAAE